MCAWVSSKRATRAPSEADRLDRLDCLFHLHAQTPKQARPTSWRFGKAFASTWGASVIPRSAREWSRTITPCGAGT